MTSAGGNHPIPYQLTLFLVWPGTAIFVGVGAAFGYWMDGVEERQRETVQRLQNKLVAAREMRAERQTALEAKSREAFAELEEKTRQAAQ